MCLVLNLSPLLVRLQCLGPLEVQLNLTEERHLLVEKKQTLRNTAWLLYADSSLSPILKEFTQFPMILCFFTPAVKIMSEEMTW